MLQWKWQKFSDLSLDEFHDIIALREEVFVVEQNCVYLDVDGLDRTAWHLSGWEGNQLVAYLRVMPENTRYKEVSFGRVVTAPKARGKGYGKELTNECLKCIENEFGKIPVRISAQAYLESFYGKFGFVKDSGEYLEDDIPHIQMLRN